jgi:hypothetical protein
MNIWGICPGSAEEWGNCTTGRWGVCHVTVLPGQSQGNLPNSPSAHLYSGGGGCQIFPSLPLPAVGQLETLPGRQPNQSEWKRPIIFSYIFYLFKVLLKKYILYKEMSEDKKIVKMLLEEYI